MSDLLITHGVNHIDTAHGYGKGNSETLIGAWYGRTPRPVLLGDQDRRGRLRTDAVDMIQLHGLTDRDRRQDWGLCW